jgi:hypothetical protein
MPSHMKRWILVRGCEYNPDGILSLGQILSSPFDPSNPLLPDYPVPATNTEHSYQQSVDISSSNSLGGSFGLWADVNFLPIGADVGGSAQIRKYNSWHFDCLEGQITVPRLEDIANILNTEDALKHIRRSRFNFRKRLYIVTGVRIARGARLDVKNSMFTGAQAKLGVDLTMIGGPANAGPKGSFSKAKETAYSFQQASDFVYAYRLNEIHYGKEISMKSYTKGETHAIQPPAQADEGIIKTDMEEQILKYGGDGEYQFEVEGLEGSDFNGEGKAPHVLKLSSNDGDMEEFMFMASETDST